MLRAAVAIALPLAGGLAAAQAQSLHGPSTNLRPAGMPLPGLVALAQGASAKLEVASGTSDLEASSDSAMSDNDNIRQTGRWRGLIEAFNPQCWSSSLFDLSSDCAEAFPVFVGFIAIVVVLLTCSMHWIRRRCNECKRSRRLEKAAKSAKTKDQGNFCPNGHPLVRHRAAGGRQVCNNCMKKIEYIWGCRDCKWGLCQTCHVELLATRQGGGGGGGNVEMPKRASPSVKDQPKPMTVEVVLTMETLIDQGNNVHKWFDFQIAEQARAVGIRDEFLHQLDQNVEVLDAIGGIYGSYMEFAEKISPEKFPIIFRFSTHPTVAQQQRQQQQLLQQQQQQGRHELMTVARRMSQESLNKKR